jgi:hypothetical protein
MEGISNPPPHMLFYEPMEDRATLRAWEQYKKQHTNIDFHEIDAAVYFSVEEFGRMFEMWVSSKSSKRIKLLMVWHAHFLSLACQQALRRLLETKSFRSRVWFHVEFMNNVQSAIVSRCIVRRLQESPSVPESIVILENE